MEPCVYFLYLSHLLYGTITSYYFFLPPHGFRPEGEILRRYLRKVLTVKIYSQYARKKSRIA